MLDPRGGGEGEEGVTVSSSASDAAEQVTHTVYKTPAAVAQWRSMFIDVSGRPRVHNMAERNKHQHTGSSESREQMNKQANRLGTVGSVPLRDVFTQTSQKSVEIYVFNCIIIAFVVYFLFYK